ncbi:MAG: hypothetical protein VX397_00620 [Pseudomonadota bacterium]|nr:hypothetical protein [Pseudomonadota bacterium]
MVVPKEHAETIVSEVEGHGNEREAANRSLDGKIPPRVYKSIPYYKRSGAEDKVKKMKEIEII